MFVGCRSSLFINRAVVHYENHYRRLYDKWYDDVVVRWSNFLVAFTLTFCYPILIAKIKSHRHDVCGHIKREGEHNINNACNIFEKNSFISLHENNNSCRDSIHPSKNSSLLRRKSKKNKTPTASQHNYMMILSIYIRIEYTNVFQIHAKKRGACTVHYYKTLVVVNVVVSHVGDLNIFLSYTAHVQQ